MVLGIAAYVSRSPCRLVYIITYIPQDINHQYMVIHPISKHSNKKSIVFIRTTIFSQRIFVSATQKIVEKFFEKEYNEIKLLCLEDL